MLERQRKMGRSSAMVEVEWMIVERTIMSSSSVKSQDKTATSDSSR